MRGVSEERGGCSDKSGHDQAAGDKTVGDKIIIARGQESEEGLQ